MTNKSKTPRHSLYPHFIQYNLDISFGMQVMRIGQEGKDNNILYFIEFLFRGKDIPLYKTIGFFDLHVPF